MKAWQLTLIQEIEPIPIVRETELKTLPFCPICQRLNVLAYKSESWCVECKNGKHRFLEACFPELIRYRGLPREDKAFLKPWDIRAIWLAADYTCLKCKRNFVADLTRLHLDHVVPRASGGPSTIHNLQCLCQRHNSQKQASTDWRSWDFRPEDWLERLNVARNQLRNWTVGGRSFEEMLRELISG